MNNLIKYEVDLHNYYGTLTEVDYHALIKMKDIITDKQMIAYCTNVCYGSNLNTNVIPKYMHDTIRKCNNIFANQKLDMLLNYYQTFFKNNKTQKHMIRNASIFQRFIISTFLPPLDLIIDKLNPNNIYSDYTYYLIKLIGVLPYHETRLSNILYLFESHFKLPMSRKQLTLLIKKHFDLKGLDVKSLAKIFNKEFNMLEPHLFHFFILAYAVYQIRKYKCLFSNIHNLEYNLTSHGLESMKSHSCDILNKQYRPEERSIILDEF